MQQLVQENQILKSLQDHKKVAELTRRALDWYFNAFLVSCVAVWT